MERGNGWPTGAKPPKTAVKGPPACPELVIIPPSYDVTRQFSRTFDAAVEEWAESILPVTGRTAQHGVGERAYFEHF